MVDKIIDIQNINEELSLLLEIPIEFPIINTSKTKDYKDYYVNKEMMDIVRKKYTPQSNLKNGELNTTRCF